MNKKGQSALEFITTYGWALVVVLLVISSSWFTFGGHKMFVNEKCLMGPGFLCKDFLVDEGSIQLKVLNGQGKNIDSFSFDVPSCTIGSDTPSILNGDEKFLSVSGCTFSDGVFEGPLNFEYSFDGSSIGHSKVADITAIIQGGNSGGYSGGTGGNGGSGGYVSDGVTQLLYKFDEGDGALIRDETSNGYDGTLITIGDLVDNRGAETGDLLNFQESPGFEGVNELYAHNGTYSFYDEKSHVVFSDELFPIDMNTEYNLEGWFMKYGTGDSKIYFGYVPYDENKNIIVRRYVFDIAGTDTSLYDDVKSTDTTLKVLDASKWNTASSYYRYVAFNTDNSGNFNDMPNSNLSNKMGVKDVCNITVVDKTDYWEVNLCGGQTVGVSAVAGTNVRQHQDGGTYMYTAAAGNKPGTSWTKYSSTTQGEDTTSTNLSKWWRGTKYAKILFLMNYGDSSGNSKTRVDDIILTSNPVKYTNKWDNGYYGGAVDFNGYDDQIKTGVTGTDLDTIGNGMITVEAWIKPRSLPDPNVVGQAYRTIVGNWNWNNGGWLLRVNSNRDLLFHISDGDDSGGQDTAVCSGSLVQEGVWQHVAGVWDGNEVRTYINGVECGSQQFSNYVESSLEVTIGWSTINNNLPIYFDGLIDEVRISDYVRYS